MMFLFILVMRPYSRQMAEETGGIAFFPQGLGEVDAITQQIAHDIRNQYTIGYKPTKPQAYGILYAKK